MVSKSSPDWLPAGWAVQFRVTRGRQIEYYTNVGTGENVFSKDDVMRSVEKERSHFMESPIEHPEWLPKSWKVELRTRKAGAQVGRKYKCYIDPSTKGIFYSKPEVIRYLKTVKPEDCKSTNFRTVSPVRCITRQMAVPSKQLETKVDVQKHNVEDEGLPPGWTKEIKVRATNQLKRDPYYTDPVSGYVFRSKRDVMHYLATGERSRHAFKPKSTCRSELEQSSATKRQKVKHPVTRRQLSGDKCSSEMRCSEQPEDESSNLQDKRVPTESRDTISSAVKVVQEKHLTEFLLEEFPKTREDCSPSGLSQPAAEVLYKCEGKRSLLEVEGSMRDPDKSSIRIAQTDSSKSKNKNKLSLPSRSSKRLAGLDPEHLANIVSSEQALRAASSKPSKSHASENAGLASDHIVNTASQPSKSHASEDAGLASDHIVNTASQQLGVTSKTEVAEHGLTDIKSTSHEEPLNKGRMPIDDKVGLKEKQIKLEIEKTPTGKSPITGSVVSGPIQKPPADMLQKVNSLESGIDKSCSKKTRASKSKKSTELKSPHRSSKRLAGVEPEQLMVSSERVLRAATRKLSKSDHSEEAVLASDHFINTEHWAASETEVAEHTATGIKFTSREEPLNKGKMPVDDEVIAKEQQQKLETQKMDAQKQEPELSILFRSDPSVEFAIKLLTGQLPIVDTSDMSISKPTADMLQKDGSLESGMKKSCSRKTRASKSKKNNELKLSRWSSKKLAGVGPELLVGTTSSDRPVQNSIESSGKSKCTTVVDLADERSQWLKAGSETNLASHPCTATRTSLQAEPSNNREKSLANQPFPEDKPFEFQTEKADVENPEQQFSSPSMGSWSDPWLDFAFKTLTGTIPIEDEMFPGYIQEKLDTSHNHRDTMALPDFGSASFFQSDILPQFDAPEQSASQQLLTNSLLLPSANASISNCSGAMGQQSFTSSSSLSAGNVSLSNCTGVCSGQPLSRGSSFLPPGIMSFSNCSGAGSGHQLPTNSWSLPPGNVSFSNCSGVGSGRQLPTSSSFITAGNVSMSSCPTNSSFLSAGNVSLSSCCGVASGQPLSMSPSPPPTGNVSVSSYCGVSSGQPSTTSSSFLPAGNSSLSNYSGVSSVQQLPLNSSFLPPGNADFPNCSGVSTQNPCLGGANDYHGKVKS